MIIMKKRILFMAIILTAMIFAIPQTASAASKSVTVGSLVVTTTHEDGLIKDVDYSKKDLRYDALVLTTAKPVTITMKEGKEISYNSIIINNVGGISSADVTLSNLNLKSKTAHDVIAIWSSEKSPFDVQLTFKGNNTLNSTHSTHAAIGVEKGTGKVIVKGGTLTTNSDFVARGNLTFENTTLKFKGSGADYDYRIHTSRSYNKTTDGDILLNNVKISTNSSTRHVPILSDHGKITIKNSDINGKKIDAPKGINIENSTLDLHLQSNVGIIRSTKGSVTNSDSDVSFETSTGFESHICRGIAAPQNTVTILRSNIKTKCYGSRSDYAISGKKIKITSSILDIRGYDTGLKAKSDGITITSSEVDIDANKKAIVIGPKKSGSIALSKLSLSGSKLKNGTKKGRYSNSNGSYLTIKTSSGKNAADVEISMTKPARPVVTISNVEKIGKIKLTWAKSPLADKYQVWRATSKSGKYTLMKTTKSGSYTNTSAVAEKTYYYKVRAISGSKKSSYSVIKSRTCDLARPVIIVSNVDATGEIKVSWDKIKGADQYQVWYAASKTGKYTLLDKTTSRSFIHAEAEPGQTYYYKVKAISTKNANANSAFSTTKKGTSTATSVEQ